MERPSLSEMDIYHRTREISHYLKILFDVPPPVE
jgi:hypothetical protein